MTDETAPEHTRFGRRELARELTARYAFALDDGNWSDLGGVFADDARLIVSVGDFRGRETIVSWYREYLEAAMPGWAGRHFVTNHRFLADTEHGLEMQCYFFNTFRGPSESIIGWGRYELLVRFSDAGAEIAQMAITVDTQTDVREGWVL